MDTLEVIDLYLCAPVLYSKTSVAKQIPYLKQRRFAMREVAVIGVGMTKFSKYIGTA